MTEPVWLQSPRSGMKIAAWKTLHLAQWPTRKFEATCFFTRSICETVQGARKRILYPNWDPLVNEFSSVLACDAYKVSFIVGFYNNDVSWLLSVAS